jgi:hypothetical protein
MNLGREIARRLSEVNDLLLEVVSRDAAGERTVTRLLGDTVK